MAFRSSAMRFLFIIRYLYRHFAAADQIRRQNAGSDMSRLIYLRVP